MIDIKQLRLRNLITNNQGITIRIDFVSKSQIGYNCGFGDSSLFEEKEEFEFCENIYHFKPIELTEEWLVRFNFLKTTQWVIEFGKIEKQIPILQMLRLTHNKKLVTTWGVNLTTWSVHLESFIGDERVGRTFIQQDLKYVHELQNLYFSLSGEDLELIK